MSTRQSKSSKTKKTLKTFTYFLPAPPQRKSGYREKEFDKIMQGILQSGFEIVEIQTQAVSTGMFIFAMLATNSKKVADLDINLDIQEQFRLRDTHPSGDIILEEEIDE